MRDFYHDWLFFGGLAGICGSLITLYFHAKRKGVENINWKQISIIFIIFLFPTIILPLLLLPGIPWSNKIGYVIAIILFGIARYYATTKGQEAMAKLRELKKKKGDKRD